MKPADNINNLFEKSKITVGKDVDKKILDEAMNALPHQATQPDRNIWSIIMHNKLTKPLAAAIIIIAALTGIYQLAGSIDGAGVAFADVKNAFMAESWVHLKYDNGTESWYNLKTGDHGHKQLHHSGESFVYINRKDNLRWRYTPAYGQHINEDRPTAYPDNYVIPTYEPKTVWSTIIGPWEMLAENGGTQNCEVEIHDDMLDGKSSIRFDIYYIDALERRLLTKQLWADPVTSLPMKIKEMLTAQQQKDQNREYITGNFSFPETGPESIYSLGVPEDLPIAKDYDKVAIPSIDELIDIAKHYYENFPKQCRAVIWRNDYAHGMIEIVWRNGEKIHFNHYSTVGQMPTEHPLNLPANVEDVLAWSRTQPPISIYMDDEKKSYHRSYHPAFEEYKTPKVRVTKSWRRGLPGWAHFIEKNWQYMEYDIKRFSYINDAPDSLSHYIGIKTESGDIRRDYYIDPENGYLQVQNIWWKLRDGQWQKEREYVATELSQLPEGQWYVGKRKLIIYPNPEKGTSGSESNYNIDITLLEENQFPPDLFNGEKLMENAEIETY